MKSKILHIKNMICPRCITVISGELQNMGVEFEIEKLGEITIFNPSQVNLDTIVEAIEKHGFQVLKDRELLIVEQIKLAIIDLVHHQESPLTLKNSDYLEEKIGKSYSSLSKLFSKHQKITIERYIILQKIKKSKGIIRIWRAKLK